MLYLASSSSSRAKLLKNLDFEFKQVQTNYDESSPLECEKPENFAQRIVLQKEKQFLEHFLPKEFDENKDKLLFADSIVSLEKGILTKAKDDDEALEMLHLQSGKEISIISAMILSSSSKRLFSVSKTSLLLDKFEKKDIQSYIKSKEYKGKAGCVMCEGFHKKYIKKMTGDLNTALGLDTKTLKAYL